MNRNSQHIFQADTHVFDRYHALWFPIWCLWGTMVVLGTLFLPLRLSGSVAIGFTLVVTWTILAVGTGISAPREGFVRILVQGTLGFLLVPAGRLLTPGLGSVLTSLGLLLLVLMPRRSDGFPETGDLSLEWICGAILAFQLSGPSPTIPLAAIAGTRFISGFLYRLIPVRRFPDRMRTTIGIAAWVPLWGYSLALVFMPGHPSVAFFGSTAVAFRLAFHLFDGTSRLKKLGELVPRGSRAGLFRTFVIYYRIPFRRWKMRRFYRAFLPPNGSAWDVGAHLGNRSRVWLDLGMQVTAFEPQPACAGLLNNWYGACSRFKLIPKAVGSRQGMRTLHLSSRFPTLASVSDDWVRRMTEHPLFDEITWETEIEVEQTTISAISGDGPRADFIKVDVEGSEASVIKGIDDVPGALSFEFLPPDPENSVRCLDLLSQKAEWTWNVSIKEQFRFLFPNPVSREQLQDWLTSRRDDDPSGDIYGWRK